MKKHGTGTIVLIMLCILQGLHVEAKQIMHRTSLTDEVLNVPPNTDFHLTGSGDILKNSTICLAQPDSWLFFDQIKPSVFLASYKNGVKIGVQDLMPGMNARICKYINGTLIIPQSADYTPLTLFKDLNLKGDSLQVSVDWYYTDKPGEYVPSSLRKPLGTFNDTIRSFCLKRGYMATLANNPDGTGYSRVFIADTGDVVIRALPELLDRRISFVRIFKWDWVSKKGWCGTTDVEAQADQVDGTWFYSWGASGASTSNLEFCPEKWGTNWPGWSDIASKTGVCHLLSYNEPDHSEQSNVPVVTAVAEWPRALQTGMRLGSPATTDYNWLYQFMDLCAEKNYRVDYVVIHGYWGGLSPQEWYDKLRLIHEKTGKPIWIKEWNNGANWTKEGWPTGTDAQQQKQLNDLKGILNVLDTAHYIERYSIYNWVEDKRAMILNWSSATKSGTLTPAGLYYKNNPSTLAYNPENETIPVWQIHEAPVLKYDFERASGKIHMKWSDYNEEMITAYQLEVSSDQMSFTPVRTFNSGKTHECLLDLPEVHSKSALYYRLQSVGTDGSVHYSNTVSCQVVNTGLSFLPVSNGNSTLNLFAPSLNAVPVLIAGTPTNHNKFPLFPVIRDLNSQYFNFQLSSWNYQASPLLTSTDTVALLSFTPGKIDMNGIHGWAGKLAGAGTAWMSVQFPENLPVVPVVLCNTSSRNNLNPSIVQIRNVSTAGFEVSLRFEDGAKSDSASEQLDYMALTPGTGQWNNYRVKAGLSEAAACGSFLKSKTILTGDSLIRPLIFSGLQTTSDGIASDLRVKRILAAGIEFFQERELSKATTDVSKEQIGWLLFDTADTNTALRNTTGNHVLYNAAERRFVASEKLADQSAAIVDLCGRKWPVNRIRDFSARSLPPGMYILDTEDTKPFQFIIH